MVLANGKVKLVDFGMAAVLPDRGCMLHEFGKGTPLYQVTWLRTGCGTPLGRVERAVYAARRLLILCAV